MSYMRGVSGVSRRDDESNESVYERCGMGSCANEVQVQVQVKCGVVEWLKINILR